MMKSNDTDVDREHMDQKREWKMPELSSLGSAQDITHGDKPGLFGDDTLASPI